MVRAAVEALSTGSGESADWPMTTVPLRKTIVPAGFCSPVGSGAAVGVTVAVRMTAVPCATEMLLAARVTVTGTRIGLTGKRAAARGDRERLLRRTVASRGPKLCRCIPRLGVLVRLLLAPIV